MEANGLVEVLGLVDGGGVVVAVETVAVGREVEGVGAAVGGVVMGAAVEVDDCGESGS